jgi:2-amino-4-hydroxy-6-hydroxymethyldihydropteridine diphosphokinase
MDRVFISMGTNMGDRMANLAAAVDRISDIDLTHVDAVSHAYESEPWGDPDQPLFANAVMEVHTDLTPTQLLEALEDVERELGREPGPRNAPRPIDLDIVMYGDDQLSSDQLTIPHPRAAERAFVVKPLLCIAPDATWPDGSAVDEFAATEGRIIRDLGAIRDEGADHNRPIGDMDWVAVAETTEPTPAVAGPDFGIMYQASLLQEEEIPIAWDPWDPSEGANPWGLSVTLRLLVPAPAAERARALLAGAAQAVPVLDEEVEFAIESESEDPAERESE